MRLVSWQDAGEWIAGEYFLKFTIERWALVRMIELVRRGADLKLSACAARVFVATGDLERDAKPQPDDEPGTLEFPFMMRTGMKKPEKPEGVTGDKMQVVVAGREAFVLEDGECLLPREMFLRLLKSYKGQKNCTIEADETGLRIGKFSMSVKAYSLTATPPAEFHVFPVTDLGVAGSQSQPLAQYKRNSETTDSRPPRS